MFDKKLKTKLKKKIFNNLLEIVEEKDFKDLNFLISTSILLKYKKLEFKKYLRLIKKSIRFLEKNFDDVYLLYYSLEHNRKVFYYNQNSLILDSLYFLTEILNDEEYIKESERVNNILSKIELGVERYFLHNKIIVDKFSESVDLLEIKNEEIDFESKLKDKKYQNYIECFPEKIYTKKTKHLLEVKKSLFSHDNLDIKKFSKENIILEHLNSIYIMIQSLALIENGK